MAVAMPVLRRVQQVVHYRVASSVDCGAVVRTAGRMAPQMASWTESWTARGSAEGA